MTRHTAIRISVILLSALLLLAGCSAPANAPAATTAPAATSAAPAASSAAPSAASTATKALTASPSAQASASAAASATATGGYTVDSPAFKLYNLVTLGMTKDEADKATGQVGVAQSDDDKANNLFTYTDDQGCGVRVTFNGQNKAYSKEAFYNDYAGVLGPLSPVAVTHDQYDQISFSSTFADVSKLLGSDGVIGAVIADKADCTSIQMLKRFWGNKDGSYIEVDFKADGSVDTLSYNEYQPE